MAPKKSARKPSGKFWRVFFFVKTIWYRGCGRMKLPVVSGSEAVNAFRKLGCEFDEQRGSHIVVRHVNPAHRRRSVPNHKELAKGPSGH
jgi:predicted RNA binding protein YcfA (HicA-like mRNA interferase family)